MRTRNEILSDLVANKGEIAGLTEELSHYSWDCEDPLYTINPDDIYKVLNQYSQGNVDSKTIEDWANAIESRDDLDFENEEIHEIITEIANPVLFGNISDERVEHYRKKLPSM